MIYPVELTALHGRIKHTWLENCIINKGTNRILDLWLDELRWEALDTEFHQWEIDAEEFGYSFVAGFSPARFTEILKPLARMSEPVRRELSEALDAIHHSTHAPRAMQPQYQSALKVLRLDLANLRTSWDLPKSGHQATILDYATQLVNSATALRDILEKIPKGVVIP
jgi:hypothetical protein